jgi:hypothetical protein
MNFYDNINKWPVKIRLYPEPATSSLYCLAHIWPNNKTMIKEVNKLPYMGTEYYKIKKNEGVMATALPLSVRRDNRLMPVFSHIHFCTEYLEEFTISHELLHAAIAWQHRVELDKAFMFSSSVNRDEERFCYAHGAMVLQLTARLSKLGMYK